MKTKTYYRYYVPRKCRNSDTGETWVDHNQTNSLQRAKALLKDFNCLGTEITVFDAVIIDRDETTKRLKQNLI